MKIKDFLGRNISPFLFGAFLSRIMSETKDGKKYFYCYTEFRSSKVVPQRLFDISEYGKTFIDDLNFISGVRDWKLIRCNNGILEARFYVENNLKFSKTAFYNTLYSKFIKSSWVHADGLTNDKKDFIRGFIELRGSVDPKVKYISEDYYFDSPKELKKAQIVTDFMNVPIEYANFNMRNLQRQFVENINKRNPQFRINSFFYAKHIGFLNKYKAKIFSEAFNKHDNYEKNRINFFNLDVPKSKSDSVAFIKYLNFFSNNIYQKELTPAAVVELRKRIGFHINSGDESAVRNRTIVELFDNISQDKCAICGTETTYTRPDGRQYFEIHHVISRYNGSELDNIANLVKLCPTCHRMLKKNGATKETQINAIIKILNEHSEIFEFCSSYLDEDNIVELANKIQSMLG